MYALVSLMSSHMRSNNIMNLKYYTISKTAVNAGMILFVILLALDCICLFMILNMQRSMESAIEVRNKQFVHIEDRLNSITSTLDAAPCILDEAAEPPHKDTPVKGDKLQ